jgi:hypothetical protein
VAGLSFCACCFFKHNSGHLSGSLALKHVLYPCLKRHKQTHQPSVFERSFAITRDVGTDIDLRPHQEETL